MVARFTRTRQVRRMLGVAVALVMLAWDPAVARLCGDVDDDGRVTVTDGVSVLRTAASLSGGCTGPACDPDGSGSTTVTDGVIVLRVAAALPVVGACEDDACVFGAETIEENLEIPPASPACSTAPPSTATSRSPATSSLTATDVLVGGNIQGQEALFLDVLDSEVRGDVQFERGGASRSWGNASTATYSSTTTTASSWSTRTTSEGDLQAFQNQGGLSITFTDNTIGGNLQCKENDPPPVGGGNVVDGNEKTSARGCELTPRRFAQGRGAAAAAAYLPLAAKPKGPRAWPWKATRILAIVVAAEGHGVAVRRRGSACRELEEPAPTADTSGTIGSSLLGTRVGAIGAKSAHLKQTSGTETTFSSVSAIAEWQHTCAPCRRSLGRGSAPACRPFPRGRSPSPARCRARWD